MLALDVIDGPHACQQTMVLAGARRGWWQSHVTCAVCPALHLARVSQCKI